MTQSAAIGLLAVFAASLCACSRTGLDIGPDVHADSGASTGSSHGSQGAGTGGSTASSASSGSTGSSGACCSNGKVTVVSAENDVNQLVYKAVDSNNMGAGRVSEGPFVLTDMASTLGVSVSIVDHPSDCSQMVGDQVASTSPSEGGGHGLRIVVPAGSTMCFQLGSLGSGRASFSGFRPY